MKPVGIVLHLTASNFGDAKQIDRWHKQQGWSGIGYHRVVLNGVRNKGDAYTAGIDGSVEKGRPDNVMGAHCKAEGMNRCTIGITCVGTPNDLPDSAQAAPAEMVTATYLTARQFVSLVDTAAQLCVQYGLDPAGTFVHPATNRTERIISQHSQHEPGKPGCASLRIDNVRQAIIAEVSRLGRAHPAGIDVFNLSEVANEINNPEAAEISLPEFSGTIGDSDGPAEPDTDVEP